MEKQAYVSITILISYEPKDVHLDDDCTRDEFTDVVSAEVDEVIDTIAQSTGLIANDICIDVLGDFN